MDEAGRGWGKKETLLSPSSPRSFDLFALAPIFARSECETALSLGPIFIRLVWERSLRRLLKAVYLRFCCQRWLITNTPRNYTELCPKVVQIKKRASRTGNLKVKIERREKMRVIISRRQARSKNHPRN